MELFHIFKKYRIVGIPLFINHSYDYIITGGGLAGLSLVHHLGQSTLRNKRILIIDETWKIENDRTWCYWENGTGIFDNILHHEWRKVDFFSPKFSDLLDIAPYTYKMVRGIDFYKKIQAEITVNENITFLKGKVQIVENQGNSVRVIVDEEQYIARYCFNSIPFEKVDKTRHLYLAQHFKGWIIRTEKPAFDASRATLMDFRLPHEGETKFVYVLPTNAQEALVEMTFFSPDLLEDNAYNLLIRNYIQDYLPEVGKYEILHEEFGVIPMTNFRFSKGEENIINIGTAGGHTKASSGYTFWYVQQYLAQIVSQLERDKSPHISAPIFKKRFVLYDAIFLNVLQKKRLAPPVLFGTFFEKNKPSEVLAFLSEETSFLREIKVIWPLPKMPFLRALWDLIFGKES